MIDLPGSRLRNRYGDRIPGYTLFANVAQHEYVSGATPPADILSPFVELVALECFVPFQAAAEEGGVGTTPPAGFEIDNELHG
jgi:hypothetical protein